jgi:hypothetical protein
MNKHIISETISSVNAQITEIRTRLMAALAIMIPEGRFTFDGEYAPNITDEEDCVRFTAKSVSKEQVTLSDETTLDLGDIGTDDLNNLVDAVYNELYIKEK